MHEETVKQGKSQRGAPVLIGLTLLMTLLSAMAGCTSSASKPVGDVSQLAASQGTTEVRTTKPYVLDVGDEVVITVWGFDDLKRTAIISASGDIYYPLAGRLQLAGKTVSETQEMLTARLKKYIVDPQVEMTSTMGRQQIYVMGEVNNPTTISYTRPLLVTEAIAKANWFKPEANKSKVLLVRRTEDQFKVYEINAGAALKDGSKSTPVYLQAGDLIYVPPTVITNIARFMSNIQAIMQPFMSAEQMIILWPSLQNAFKSNSSSPLSISTPSSSPPSSSGSSGSSQ